MSLEPVKPQIQTATKAGSKAKATKKPIVPEMEYAYFDEVKKEYKDPVVEGIPSFTLSSP